MIMCRMLLLSALNLEPELIAEGCEIISGKEILESVSQGIGQPMKILGPTEQRALHDAPWAATVEAKDGVLNFLSRGQLTQSVVLQSLDETRIDATDLAQHRAR